MIDALNDLGKTRAAVKTVLGTLISKAESFFGWFGWSVDKLIKIIMISS